MRVFLSILLLAFPAITSASESLKSVTLKVKQKEKVLHEQQISQVWTGQKIFDDAGVWQESKWRYQEIPVLDEKSELQLWLEFNVEAYGKKLIHFWRLSQLSKRKDLYQISGDSSQPLDSKVFVTLNIQKLYLAALEAARVSHYSWRGIHVLPNGQTGIYHGDELFEIRMDSDYPVRVIPESDANGAWGY